MTREELDFIGSMNMCDEISDDAYKKIVCHCEEQEPTEWEQDHKLLKACGDAVDIVLDDINAEIEKIETYDGLYIDRAYVLQIIDKYKEW